MHEKKNMPVYLLSADHPGFRKLFVPMVGYRPDDPETPIDIGDGYGPHCVGRAFTLTEALAYRHTFDEAHAAWFIPFLERLALGETVSIQEIQDTYKRLFGKEMPCAMSYDL